MSLTRASLEEAPASQSTLTGTSHLREYDQYISVFISRSEIISLQSKYDNQLADWKKQCDDKDKEIAALKAEIAKLKAEIKKLKER